MRRPYAYLLILLLCIPALGWSGTITFGAPTHYTTGEAIAPDNVALIVYKIYIKDTKEGEWVLHATTAPGITSATVPLPSGGQSIWYTVDATLDAATSDKQDPVFRPQTMGLTGGLMEGGVR